MRTYHFVGFVTRLFILFSPQARDDAFANEVEIQDADDKDEEPESPYKTVQVELAVSETKPYTRLVSKTKLYTWSV